MRTGKTQSIGFKLLSSSMSLSVLTFLVLGIVAVFSVNSIFKNNTDFWKRKVVADYDEQIRSQTLQMRSFLAYAYSEFENNQLTFDEAKKQAADYLRAFRYRETSKGGYFFVYTSDGTNIVMPSLPEREGTNCLDFKDFNGKPYIRTFIEIAKSSDSGGIIEIYSRKNDLDMEAPELKRNYVVYFEPFDWILGTGSFITDIKETAFIQERLIFDYKKNIEYILFGIWLAAFFVSIFVQVKIASKITKPIISLIQKNAKFIQKNIDANYVSSITIPFQGDEISALEESQEQFMETLHKYIDELNSANIRASTDSMTKLRNREAFYHDSCAEAEKRESRKYYFCLIDLDFFKEINDCFGHAEGDRVLIRFAESLRNVFGEKSIIARMGGDEFGVFCSHLKNEEQIKEVVEKFKSEVFKIKKGDSDNGVTTSIGIAAFNAVASDFNFRVLYNQADNALYKVKKKGRDGWEIFR